jgi:hypothetical protein
MKKCLIILLLLFTTIYSQAQQQKKHIIYSNMFFGGAFAPIQGNREFIYGVTLHYHQKNNFFSLRYSENTRLFNNDVYQSPLSDFPIEYTKKVNKEVAILYGLLWTYKSHSLSLSAGISTNDNINKLTDNNKEQFLVYDHYFATPFEININFFKPNKNKYKLYGVIPIGKPTGFGRSIGFKILGNISKNNYIGFGITYGWGIHKVYN